MLRTRILTALVLLALLLPTLFLASPVVFAAVTGVFWAAGVWEWMRLCGYRGATAVVLALLWGVGAGALATALPASVLPFAVAAVAWLALLGLTLPRAALPRWLAAPPLLGALGALIMAASWLALLRARSEGAGLLLSVLAVAWVADVAAYFGGRAIGGPKLAPRISPGKTRAGVWSAAAAMLVYAATCAALPSLSGTLFARIERAWGWAPMLAVALVLLLLTVAGDLFESLLKRHAGAKDSSGLLPGHGGVLDRIDALLPLLPVALLCLA